jgi:hypothetical protein
LVTAKNSSKPSSISAEFQRLGAWLFGPGRAAVFWALLVGLFIVGPYYAWQYRFRERLAGDPAHQVGPRQVEITPLPDWIRSDLCVEAFRDPLLDGSLSILDDDLVERISGAFSRHPWVARVVRVSKVPKRSSAMVRVELVYRRPACMVESSEGPLPVDADGFLLPAGENFSPGEIARYPHLTGVDQPPNIPPGRRWQDPRVIGGSEIAAAIGPAWTTLRLRSIAPLASDPALAAAGRPATEPFFELVTCGGSHVYWGYAPGANAPGELSAAEKVGRLQRRVTDYDTLDGADGRPQQLDVRTLSPSVAP